MILPVQNESLNTFKFHCDLRIVAVVRPNIAVDVLLFLKNGIVL